jgi:nitrous-oxide reductase
MRRFILLVLLLVVAALFTACSDDEPEPTATAVPALVQSEAGGGLPDDLLAVANDRGLTPDDIRAALKTYVPSGKWDEYYMFASGGHSGNLIVIGLPSMRILKNIGVFTPEAWQGYGIGDMASEEILNQGNVDDVEIRMGDAHHPALSETAGDYDGQWVFINDKASARIAVIDLRDFRTKQIVKDPNIISNHGTTFVTPNTEYIIQGTQYSTPFGWDYAPLDQYQEEYRGVITMWKFDREKGRIIPEESFSIEVPPYWQDLCDAGKLDSDGWGFCNSINTELFTGGNMQGNPQFEAGVSQRDVDYLHIFNWKKAAELVEAGKFEMINGMRVIRIPTAVEEGILFFAPEPKSPHGVDVTPDGKYMVVAGKLDPHVTIYSFDKIQKAIADKNWTTDVYGIPVLDFDAVMQGQVELGLGPLHTQFDGQGNAFTSLFLDSALAKWSLGGDDPAGYKLLEKTPVQYNIGHIAAAEGDTVSPDGKYLVALNKWAVDRFLPVGPLVPQNLQLVDISGEGPVKVIYDMAMGIGEPHYAQIIKADKLNPINVYPEVGWDPIAWEVSEFATKSGEERIERDGNNVTIYSTSIRSHLTPDRIELQQGDHVTWHITNIETAHDAVHGFQLGGQNVSLSIEPGATVSFQFNADTDGTYAYYCTEFCSALHLEMMGYMLVAPAEEGAAPAEESTPAAEEGTPAAKEGN